MMDDVRYGRTPVEVLDDLIMFFRCRSVGERNARFLSYRPGVKNTHVSD